MMKRLLPLIVLLAIPAPHLSAARHKKKKAALAPMEETPKTSAPKSRMDPRLVGDWGTHGEVLYQFKANGSGMMENEPFQWLTNENILVLRSEGSAENLPYKFKGKRLILTLAGVDMPFEKMSLTPPKPAAATKAAKTANDQLPMLLISSPWCSFSYNKVSGASNTKRVQFSSNGAWTLNGRGEGYSNGYGGTVASQHDSVGGGQWAMQGGQLYMSNPAEGAGLTPVGLQIKKNSNGYPILVADGVEYSQCP